jgi:Flp pilus assembly protein TadD
MLSSGVFVDFCSHLPRTASLFGERRSSAKHTNSFRINTFGMTHICSFHRISEIAKLFRINTYVKMWGRGCLAALFLVLRANSAQACWLDFFSPSGPCSPSAQEVDKSPKEADGLLVDAKSLFLQGKFNDADRAIRLYLETHPDSADAHFLLGHTLFREIQAEARAESQAAGVNIPAANENDSKIREEKAKASLAEFTAGARYRTPAAADLKAVAFDYVVLGDYVDADKWLTRMLEWTPDDSDGWYHLGRTKYNENRFAEAVSAFQQCLKLDPRNVKAEDNLGLSFAGLGRIDEAEATYRQAIAWQAESASKNPGPDIDLASLLIDQNRLQAAVTYLQEAIRIAPRESRAHELLGKAYTHLDDFPAAQAELEKAVELSPQSPNLHCMLAAVYRKQRLTEKAKVEYDRCAALVGSHSTPEAPRP